MQEAVLHSTLGRGRGEENVASLKEESMASLQEGEEQAKMEEMEREPEEERGLGVDEVAGMAEAGAGHMSGIAARLQVCG